MQKALKIAVLLTCHNRKEKTLNCLSSLYSAIEQVNRYEFDIYLVDDGSTDGTAEAVRQTFPEVLVINGTGNLYWNRGMHLAWETAANANKYSYYVWLNDDTQIMPWALTTILSECTENRIVIGSTSSKRTEKITYGGFNRYKKIIEPTGGIQTCEYFNGNIVLIPNDVFNKVGFNDSRFRHALGDFDYGLRAKKLGVELVVASQVLGNCESHDSLPTWCNPGINILQRIIELYKPLGNNPFEFFIFDFRHNGLFNAIKHFFSIHLRVLIPSIWIHYLC